MCSKIEHNIIEAITIMSPCRRPFKMKGTEVLTLSTHNLEKMTTPYHQHSYQ